MTIPVESVTSGNFLEALTRDEAWLPGARRMGAGPPIVCFAPAGAGAGFFRDWHDQIDAGRIVPVQLPGREERYGEPALVDAGMIARKVAACIVEEAWERFILLGYSFGALLAFETARQLEAMGDRRVSRVIACARAEPQIRARDSVADWPDGELVDYVRQLGGLPPEIDEIPEFLQLLLPVLRADFRANDRYSSPREVRIDAPITTLIGSDDPATSDGRAEGWANRTRGGHEVRVIDGGHFFILENGRAAFRAISDLASTDLAIGTA